ncbi:MAG: hypothetical protein GF417_09700 [Candidatus Latescibacteria bacterium]|nr:hypothetical protein [bacterium]MBD3424699.1 hypothetical protein [Candidatus Latescibacterota bacterium]
MNEGIKSYISDLFKYIDTYEKNYDSFDIEAFLQTYNGIYAVFQALREQRERAVEVDQQFLERIKQGPLSSSDLRQLTIQILISFFESIADTDGQSNRAYLYCRERRDSKRDVTYFEKFLVPLLVREGSLNNNFKLNRFFMKEIARFIEKFGSGLTRDLSPEDFNGMTGGRKLLELQLRRAGLGEDLAEDRNSLEFHLRSVGEFERMKKKGSLFEQYLRQWDYLVEESFMDRVKQTAMIVWSNIRSLFSNYRYFRLALTQRNSAYIFYGLLILLFILLAFIIPISWNSYSDGRLNELDGRVEKARETINK